MPARETATVGRRRRARGSLTGDAWCCRHGPLEQEEREDVAAHPDHPGLAGLVQVDHLVAQVAQQGEEAGVVRHLADAAPTGRWGMGARRA